MTSGRCKATQEKWRIFAFVGHGVPDIVNSGIHASQATIIVP
ncbi:hypothetical protein LEMLEM_LOCUS5706 [Lemmus lemmus]